MQYGITYSVRPFMQPLKSSRILAWPSAGAIQWLFGPASSRSVVQTKVRCSTRATSDGCERARKQLGKVSGFSFCSSPLADSWSISDRYSASEPSHQ